MQHLQTQATDEMALLTSKMHRIGVNSQNEATAMRVITFVTLVYLPATFVSVSLDLRIPLVALSLMKYLTDPFQYRHCQISE